MMTAPWQTSAGARRVAGAMLGVLLQLACPATATTPGPSVEGRWIRRVLLDREPIFSPADEARVPWLPLGVVNQLHVNTRPGVIRRELVFEPGQRLDRAALEESARKLRETNYFAQVELQPVPVGADSVDVVVRTRELWTTSLRVRYEQFNGSPQWAIEVRERNFLGSARGFSLVRSEEEDRSTWGIGASDRQLLDTHWRAAVQLSHSDDGAASYWKVERPFFKITSNWSMVAEYLHEGQSPRYYLDRDRYVRPHGDVTHLKLYALRRFATTPSGVWRAGPSFLLRHQRFQTGGGLQIYDSNGELSSQRFQVAGEPAENRHLNMPGLILQRDSRRYTQQRFLFGMGHVEDLPLGPVLTLGLSWATRALGSQQTGIWLDLENQWLAVRGPSVRRLDVEAGGLLRGDTPKNLSVSALAAWYRFIGPKWSVALGLLGGAGWNQDRHEVFTLGIDNGLRSARFREQAGDRILRANAELRWVYAPGLLDLVTPGLAVFTDVGSAWFEGRRDLRADRLQGAVGVGLRLGFNRAAEDVPIRFDLGWPILHDVHRDGPLLSIGTGHVF